MSNFPVEFLGKSMKWWVGRVEDINDPKQLGRVKVRVFGYHAQDPKLVPTKKLPWTYQIFPVTSASHSGVGTSPTTLQVGSWVIGFFADVDSGQFPFVFGTFHGVHTSANIPKNNAAGGSYPAGGGQPGAGRPGAGGPGEGGPGSSSGFDSLPPFNSGTGYVDSQGKLHLSGSPVVYLNEGSWNSWRSNRSSFTPNSALVHNTASPLTSWQDASAISSTIQTNPGNAGTHAYISTYPMSHNGKTYPAGTVFQTQSFNAPMNHIGAPTTSKYTNGTSHGYEIIGPYGHTSPEAQRALAEAGAVVGTHYGYTPNDFASHGQVASNRTLGDGTVPLQQLQQQYDMENNSFGAYTPGPVNIPDETREANEQALKEQMEQYNNECTSPPKYSYSPNSGELTCPTKEQQSESDHQKDEEQIKSADGMAYDLPCPPDIGTNPNVKVTQDKAGNKIVMDSTPGGEQMALFHGPSKSYMQIDTSGNMVFRADGDLYYRSDKNLRMSSADQVDVSSGHEVLMYSENDTSFKSKGRMSLHSEGDFDIKGQGATTLKFDGNFNIQAKSISFIADGGGISMRSQGPIGVASDSGGISINSKGNIAMEAGTDITQQAYGNWSGYSKGNTKLGSKGDTSIKSEADIKVEASGKYHNASPEALFKDGSFQKLWADEINWGAAGPESKSPNGTSPSSAADLGDPDGADDPVADLKAYSKKNKKDKKDGNSAKKKGSGVAEGSARSPEEANSSGQAKSAQPGRGGKNHGGGKRTQSKPRPCYTDPTSQISDSTRSQLNDPRNSTRGPGA